MPQGHLASGGYDFPGFQAPLAHVDKGHRLDDARQTGYFGFGTSTLFERLGADRLVAVAEDTGRPGKGMKPILSRASWRWMERFSVKKTKENQVEVLIAVESREWMDEKGRRKEKAGFAKVKVAAETSQEAQEFVDQAIEKGSFVNTDASPALRGLKGVEADYRVMANDPKALESWLPWVHRFISNAKAWIIGTHHGVDAKYL